MEKSKQSESPFLQQANPNFMVDVEPLISANQRSMRAASEAQTHFLKRVGELNTEFFRFVDRRMEQQRRAARQFMACKSAPEAYAVYGKFLETAVKEYSEEMGVLANTYTDQTLETFEEIQHSVEEIVEPIKNDYDLAAKVAAPAQAKSPKRPTTIETKSTAVGKDSGSHRKGLAE